MLAHTCDLSSRETEAGEFRSYVELHSEFEANLSYLVRPWLDNKRKKKDFAMAKTLPASGAQSAQQTWVPHCCHLNVLNKFSF